MRPRHALPILLIVVGAVLLMQSEPKRATAAFDDARLQLAVADQPAEWRQGVMGREALPADGMLFVFPRETERVFWMKNTSIPLDIIFVAANHSVMHVASADPEPGTPVEQLARYTGTAKYVIETRQGFAEAHGINPGDRVDLDLPG